MRPNSGGVAESQPMSTAVQRSPNKLWRSNSILNLWQTALTYLLQAKEKYESPTFRIRCFFYPWIRIWKNFFPDPGSPTHISKSFVTLYWVKILKSFSVPVKCELYSFKKRREKILFSRLFCCFGSGFRVRDKQPGSITLPLIILIRPDRIWH